MLNTERDLMRDYPEVIVPIDHIERVPRRIRAVLAPSSMAGTARFDLDALDAWFEEDEEVFVHPRNP